jgi:ubiquinone/menaquinone biosynthesis C-methylase UbiE
LLEWKQKLLSPIPFYIFASKIAFRILNTTIDELKIGKDDTMSNLFWSGKLTIPMKILVEANNILSFFTGSYRDFKGMKTRIKDGYEGKITDHITHYDELGYHLQEKSARYQLNGIQLTGLNILDVGCGTGALAQIAFENGASSAVCGDISAYMLRLAQQKDCFAARNHKYYQLDAENLPIKNEAFDATISGMTFGTLPDQQRALSEMVRVTKPGGLICIGAHGPEHYWEAIDASFRCINKRYILGYRLEWWPRDEHYMRTLLEKEDLQHVHSKRVIWHNDFDSGAAAYDFFAAISASWWYAKFPPEERLKDSSKTRDYFIQKNIHIITDDIVVACGYKKLSN